MFPITTLLLSLTLALSVGANPAPISDNSTANNPVEPGVAPVNSESANPVTASQTVIYAPRPFWKKCVSVIGWLGFIAIVLLALAAIVVSLFCNPQPQKQTV